MSFLAVVIWFHFIVQVERPVRRPRLLVLRGGNAEDLMDLDGADWQFANSPDEVPGQITGVVADLRSEMEPEWEKFLARCALQGIVRPGITGWAQVNQGNVSMIRAATTKLHYDFYYIKHVSVWIELLIAARTVRIVLTGFGSR